MMPLSPGLTVEEAREVAQRTLQASLGSFGFDHADVRSGPDHDGDESLFVTAVLKPQSGPMPPEVYAGARGALDDALRTEGEQRFAYFRVNRPDEPVGEAEEPA